MNACSEAPVSRPRPAPRLSAHPVQVYHTNQANYSAGDIANMNTADDLGDLEFTVRAKMLPVECADPVYARHASYDCANPEQDATDLAITKLILQVDSDKIGGYCPCNVHEGVYSCGGYHSGSACAGFGQVRTLPSPYLPTLDAPTISMGHRSGIY